MLEIVNKIGVQRKEGNTFEKDSSFETELCLLWEFHAPLSWAVVGCWGEGEKTDQVGFLVVYLYFNRYFICFTYWVPTED